MPTWENVPPLPGAGARAVLPASSLGLSPTQCPLSDGGHVASFPAPCPSCSVRNVATEATEATGLAQGGRALPGDSGLFGPESQRGLCTLVPAAPRLHV